MSFVVRPRFVLTQKTKDAVAVAFPSRKEEVEHLLMHECGNNLPWLEAADALELEPYRLAVLRRSKGDFSKLLEALDLAKKSRERLLQPDDLPYVTDGYDLPAAQPVIPGRAGSYIGIYVIDDEPRIVVQLTNRSPLQFGKIENWSPRFECEIPVSIEPRPDRKERAFQIRFTGVPGRSEDFRRSGICARLVVVTAIEKMFEGLIAPTER